MKGSKAGMAGLCAASPQGKSTCAQSAPPDWPLEPRLRVVWEDEDGLAHEAKPKIVGMLVARVPTDFTVRPNARR